MVKNSKDQKEPEATSNPNNGSSYEKNNAPSSELFVVGVGASAGGIDALSRFLASFNGIKADFCVVIVMHLSPDYKSELASILSKRCKWPVRTIIEDMKMEPRNVYVTPQNSNIHVEGDHLKLDPLPKIYTSAPSVDKFFSSLAMSKGKRGIGVILSGFGSDGSQGLIDIKNNNGFTLAQQPESAEHNSMPSSAINTASVDLVVPAEDMFEEIKRYCKNTTFIHASPKRKKSIDAIFELLEKRSGTDFSLYKPSTIMRRINRRMDYLNIKTLVEYYETIKESPRELDNLFETVLIGVTEFFRDKVAYENLKNQLTEYLNKKNFGDSIRFWSVGCATGEEPYSLNMLVHEILGPDVGQYNLQIFASDIDERALNFARKGVYHEDSLENLPENCKEKYFVKTAESYYEVKKRIKQHILFTKHDITHNPPFVKIDLVSCRNLLIYFNNNLQKQTFQIFHYSLKPNGLLFLGKSESVGVSADLFEKVAKNKIFRKAEASLGYQLKFSRKHQLVTQDKERRRNEKRNMSIVDIAKETLYHKFEYPFVIINSNAEIKEVHGSLRLYLEISEGAMNANIFKMVNPELVTVLKAQLAQVKKTGVQHSSHVVKFSLYDTIYHVRIRVAPLLYTIGDIQYYMVIFERVIQDEQSVELQKKLETTDFKDLKVKELEEELEATKEHLRIFTEELEVTNEELQSMNEELQSSNEELKSSNEELETSNEELQSANEELNTANNELRLSNESLIQKEEELKREKAISEKNERIYKSIAENIPNGTVGILDENLDIQYLAGEGLRTFNYKAEELIGQNLIELNPSKKEQAKLKKVFQNTLRGKSGSIEFTYGDRYYHLQTVPLSLNGDSKKRIMYLSQNITEQKLRETKLNIAIDAADLIVYEWNSETDIFEKAPKLNEFLHIDPNTSITGDLFMEQIEPEDHPDIQKAWKKAEKTGMLSFEGRLLASKFGTKWIKVLGKLLYDDEDKVDRVIAMILDVTQEKQLLEATKSRVEQFREIANTVPAIIWISDTYKNTTFLNDNWYEYTGGSAETDLDRGWLDRVHPADQGKFFNIFNTSFEKRSKFKLEFRLRNREGGYCWFINQGKPMIDDSGIFKGYIGSCVDINDRKEFTDKLEDMVQKRTQELNEANEELVKVNMNLEEYAYVTSHDLQEPVRKIRTFNSILQENIKDKEAIEYSKKIEKSAERMTALVNNVLDYSKLSNLTALKEPVDLKYIVDNIVDDLELLIKEKKAEVSYDNLGVVQGMELQLQQLFSNIIKNAIKFNEQTPKVKITSKKVNGEKLRTYFKSSVGQDYLEVKITDNGIGIDEEFQEQVFKPFRRLNSKTKYGGTGIGLAICRRIAELHNGHITIDKSNDKGTTFLVFLPIN